MPASKLDISRVKLGTIKSAIARANPEEKKKPVSVSMAESFNQLVDEIGALAPEIASALPSRIGTRGAFRQLGFAEISYLDLEIYADQVLGLLSLIEAQE